MGDSPKWVKSKRQEKKEKKRGRGEKERLNDGNNNGQAMHGARKHAWRIQAAWAKRKREESLNNGDNNGQATHGARKHAWRTQAAWAKIVYFLYSLKYENPRKYTVWIILYVYNVKNRHYSHRKFGHVIAHLQEATRKKTPWGWGLWVGEGR